MFGDRASMNRILDYIEEYRRADGKAADEAARGLPLGFSNVGDEEFVAWFEGMVAKSPPTLITDETGMQFLASPWLAALPFSTNGDQILKRYERLTGVR